MKNIIRTLITYLAKKILNKYHPTIVGVTGSYGKTSAKEAIYVVVKKKYRVRRSLKNYNNEFGVPLTIIGAEGGGVSVGHWLRVILKAVALLVWKHAAYPEALVLEMGVDKSGDLAYLLDIALCDVGVVTAVGPVHLEAFGTEEKVAKEKSTMVKRLSAQGIAVLNADNTYTDAMREKTKAHVLTYGFSEGVSVRALELEHNDDQAQAHVLRFKLQTASATVPVALRNLVGKHQVYPLLAAAAVGQALGMHLVDIANALGSYTPPKGRMHLLDGIKHTLLIDDTYNASPESVTAAIDSLAQLHTLPGVRKIAVLGDMLELGNKSKSAHRAIGKQVAKSGIAYLLTVGSLGKFIGEAAQQAGMYRGNIAMFDDASAAGKYLQDLMHENDVVLLKGSQGVRMERVVKEVMADPLHAEALLVRQGKEWK